MEKHLPFPPGRGKLKRASIRADGIVVVGDAGPVLLESVGMVEINGYPMALNFPVARNPDVVPVGNVEVIFIEKDGTRGGTTNPVELPGTVQ
jgi:hypothetical protein